MPKSMTMNKCTSVLSHFMALQTRPCYTEFIARRRGFRALPEATGLHHRVSIHSVLPLRPPWSLYKQRQQKMHKLCWPFWWPWRCAGTIPRASPDGGCPGIQWKPLDAAIGQVFTIKCCVKSYASFSEFFHCQLVKKGSGLRQGPY